MILYYNIVISKSFGTTVLYAVHRWPKRRYEAHNCYLCVFLQEVWNQYYFSAVMIPLGWTHCLLQQKICTAHRPYVIFYTVCVLLLRATPRTLDPDVDTPRVNVDQQGEKRHKNVSSGRLTHHVVLFYYGSIATASHPPHAKCKIFQTVSVRQHNWFLSFFVFFTPPPGRALLLQTHFVQLQPCGLTNWCSSLVG